MDSESRDEDSSGNSEAEVETSVDEVTDKVKGCVNVDWPESDSNGDVTDDEFLLVLDKMDMPRFDTTSPRGDKKSWETFAETAAAYVYKSVGERVSQPLRVWLSNSASSAILHGLLGELTTSTEAGQGEDSRSPEEATTENMSIADSCLDNRQDGHWCYGRWTVDNVARESLHTDRIHEGQLCVENT
uniref:Uncharacterized protein n=1 Tax=Trichobilharzia regenti TaxID=157069 RepID=A0AA85KMY5_TRIRE|nr:unnamed protein product [Trichobilharzia regenti]